MEDLRQFIYDLQKLDTKSVISEIAFSGLNNDEIAMVCKEIALNDSWKCESKK